MNATSPPRGAVVTVYAVAVALGAALLFLIQPMFARVVLPPLGGAPAVWTTSVLFFQVLLLTAYLYAHALGRNGFTPASAALHLVVVAAGVLWLPLDIGWTRTLAAGSPPAWRLVVAATAALGLPLFAVAATAPLVQRWFTAIDPAKADQAYTLYAASNAGSLGGLLAYPFFLERLYPLSVQSRVWQAGYTALALCLVAVAIIAHRHRLPTTEAARFDDPRSNRVSWRHAMGWLVRAAVASGLMQSVTVYLTTDVAASPFLWVAPLSAYLVSFVIAFAPGNTSSQRVAMSLVPVGGLAIVVSLLTHMTGPAWLLFGVHLVAAFLLMLGCHVGIAARRPSPRHLTAFYLWIGLGGVIGSAFCVLAAPRLFSIPVEYPVLTIAACLLRPDARIFERSWRPLLADAVWIAATATFAVLVRSWLPRAGVGPQSFVGVVAVVGIPAAVAALQWPHVRRFAVLLTVMWLCSPLHDPIRVLHTRRNFFGVLRTGESEDGRFKLFLHGTTLHGAEWRDPQRSREPLSYYSRGGPAGQVFTALSPRLTGAHVAVVGLGAGALASYAQQSQTWTFIEIDSDVVDIATHEFDYLGQAAAPIRIVVDDGRLALSRVAPGGLDIIVVDAFSSDAVPVHLLTTEAIRVYARALQPNGVLLLHLSNRYLDLLSVTGSVIAASDLTGVYRFHEITEAEGLAGVASSTWVAASRHAAVLGEIASVPGWAILTAAGGTAWTDDYADVAGALKWRR